MVSSHGKAADNLVTIYGLQFTIYDLRFTIYGFLIYDLRFFEFMTNVEIARRFSRLAAMMELRGDDPFRLRSYRNAAETIEVWPTQLKVVAEEEGLAGLQAIPGIGKAIAGKVVELLDRGTFAAWEKLIVETPESVLDLMELPGIGPKTAASLHQKFKVSSIADLKKFVTGGGLNLVDGIGPKTAERIKESLEGY